MMNLGKGICNGTFGELVQGVIGETPFLITMPILTLKSEAVFQSDSNMTEIIGQPANAKAINACKKLAETFGLKTGGRLHIHSNIPAGKGMASSSADVVAALKAMAESYSLPLKKKLISKIAAEIEPTDGVMYDEVVSYDYIQGKLIERFGNMPPFSVIGIDTGGMVDTIKFNENTKMYHEQDRQQFLESYKLVKDGIQNQDFTLICEGSTISARINQKILAKPYFTEFENLAASCGGGLVIAHSGTVMGILIEEDITANSEVFIQMVKQITAIVKKPILSIFSYRYDA